MIIVAGHLEVEPGVRDAYVAGCTVVVEAARAAPGCLEFAICADPVDDARVIVYERWDSEASLLAFRGSGPSGDQHAEILSADVSRYEIAGVGPP